MYQSEKMIEDINSSLKGSLSNYAVTSTTISDDGLLYHFIAEDVGSDKTWRPATIDEIIPEDKYKIRLMSDVYWHYPSQPHCLIAGLTGSFKTSTMFVVMAQMLAVGDVYILDYKSEMNGFKSFLGDNVQSDPEKILELLERLTSDMLKRQEEIALQTAERGAIGLSGADLDFRPVFIIGEELGALTESYDSKQKKAFHGYLKQIAMLGRSSLYNLVILLQVPTVESAPAGIKSNTSLKILLGKPTTEMVIQMFSAGYADTVKGNPGKFRGWYFLAGETTQPMRFFVPDLHTHKLNNLQTFESLYQIGLERGKMES